MSQYGWISLIALSGWLVLAFGSFRAHRIGAGKTLAMALTWAAIFLLIAGIFAAIGA